VAGAVGAAGIGGRFAAKESCDGSFIGKSLGISAIGASAAGGEAIRTGAAG